MKHSDGDKKSVTDTVVYRSRHMPLGVWLVSVHVFHQQ